MSVYRDSCVMGEVLENWSKKEAVFQMKITHFLKMNLIYLLPHDGEWRVSALEIHSPQGWAVSLIALWRPKCFLTSGLEDLKFSQMYWWGLGAPSIHGLRAGGDFVGSHCRREGTPWIPAERLNCSVSQPCFPLSFLPTPTVFSCQAFFLPRFSLTFSSNTLLDLVRRTSDLLP